MNQLISQIDGIDESTTKNLKESLKNFELKIKDELEAESKIIRVREKVQIEIIEKIKMTVSEVEEGNQNAVVIF